METEAIVLLTVEAKRVDLAINIKHLPRKEITGTEKGALLCL